MNDKIIINTISKIHFIIVSFLIFIFLTLLVVFISLQNGFKIDSVSTPNLIIEELYIKWDEKINITAHKVKILYKQNNNTETDYEKLNKILKEFTLLKGWFEKIIIDKIEFNDISASLKYVQNSNGFFIASSKDFVFESLLHVEQNNITIKINKFKTLKNKIDINGNIILNLKELNLVALLNIDINNEVGLELSAYADKNKLFYDIQAKENIKNIKYILNLLSLPKEVRYWAIDAIDMTNLKLETLYGWIEYKKLNKAYKNVYVKATVNKLIYTYNQNLDSIHTDKTELEFKDGIFYIFPKQAYSYGYFLDKSYLEIDFNKKEELLTLFLKFKGALDKNILSILSEYKINLPFTQNDGKVNTNLKIDVNLITIDVKAVGDFFTKKANFNYLGLNVDIYDAYISLDNYDVKIKDMLLKYEDIASAKVNVNLNTNTHKGNIEFKVSKIEFKDIQLSLNSKAKPLRVNYLISPTQDIIDVDESQWILKDKEVLVDTLKIPFDLDKLMANIPATLIKSPNMFRAYLSGETLFKNNIAKLNINLVNFSYDKFKLSQPNTRFKLLYENKDIKLTSLNKIKFDMNEIETVLDKFSINLSKNILFFNEIVLDAQNILHTSGDGYYNLQSKSGILNLNSLHVKDKDLNDIFLNKEKMQFIFKSSKDKMTITSPELSAKYINFGEEWEVVVDSLSKISDYSKVLQNYYLTDGNISIKGKHENINFLANVKYPYKILVSDNIKLKKYFIKGKINTTTNKTHLKINNLIDVDIDEDIKIQADEVGFNIPSILKFISDRDSSTNSVNKKVIFNSKNCYLYIDKNRHVISDKIDFMYIDKLFTAQLTHSKAKANFRFKNDKFYLYGEQFNDKFMENLFALSKFKNGNFKYTMYGTTKEYSGSLIVEDTTILDYKILNNVLAFINTIPSLITFSTPGYSSTGLLVKKAYVNFKVKNDLFNINDINLKSKELNILGRGTANFKENKIDLDLNLKTDLGSGFSKIPAVGYILLGDDSISTSLHVSGALNNPEIKSKIAKEIIVAPLNILKRTLMLPFNIINHDKQ